MDLQHRSDTTVRTCANNSCEGLSTEKKLCEGRDESTSLFRARRIQSSRARVFPCMQPPAFLFTVRCACRDHPVFKNALCASSLLLAGGAQCLLCVEEATLGMVAAMLSLTSAVYHATHSSPVRAADVLLLWSFGTSGLMRVCHIGMQHGALSLPLNLAVVCIIALCIIFVCPLCYVDNRLSSDIIRLPWHVAVHAFGAAGQALLAIGCSSAQEGISISAATLHSDEWIQATVYAAALVSVMFVWHDSSCRLQQKNTTSRRSCLSHCSTSPMATPATREAMDITCAPKEQFVGRRLQSALTSDVR